MPKIKPSNLPDNLYWRERVNAEMINRIKDEESFRKELDTLYRGAQKNIETEIDAFLHRYASKEGITKQEAKKRVAAMDVEAFADKAKRYVKEKDFSPEANAELKLYNLKMRMNRAELLVYHVDLELVAMHDGQYKLMKKFIENGFVDEIIKQSGILGESVPDQETIRRIGKAVLNVRYEGATWSENIWQKQDQLRIDVAKMMSNNLMRGKSSRDLVPILRKRFKVSTYEAHRLAVTEQARVQTEGALIVFKENGYEKFNLIPEPSACDLCKNVADNNPFLVRDMIIGQNAPPIHPHCHCAVAPAVDEAVLDELFKKYEANKGAIL
ncbi:minor capsid protein [Facklamia sp. P12934]|uniref:minor capsid protein n=1 Tax=Facklamia sp. P12934 TaxID=3421948 RepID=UPI003D1758EF